MSLRTVWQRLTGLRTPPRGQPSAPSPVAPAAAPIPDPLGKQRRGYSDKAIHAGDYEDKGAHFLDPPAPWRVYVDGEPVAVVPSTKTVSVEEMDVLKGKGRRVTIRGHWNGEP